MHTCTMYRVGDNVIIVKDVAKYTKFLSYVQRHMSTLSWSSRLNFIEIIPHHF